MLILAPLGALSVAFATDADNSSPGTVGDPQIRASLGNQLKEPVTVAKIKLKPEKMAPPLPTSENNDSEASEAVLSFLKWKSMRVHDAQRRLNQVGSVGPSQQNQAKLTFNVDVALQLNIEDYFSMYMKNLSPAAFKASAQQLSTDEVSELLLAYKKSLKQGSRPSVKLTKGPKIKEKPKK